MDLSPLKLIQYKLSVTGRQAIKLGSDLEDYKLKPLTGSAQILTVTWYGVLRVNTQTQLLAKIQ